MNVPFSRRLLCLCLAGAVPLVALAAPPPGRGRHIRTQPARETLPALPAGTRAIRNVAYGNDSAQRFDAYLPANARNAPVVFYVHGGGWRRGDKTNPGLANKLAYWLPKGYAVVSTDYRMLPEAQPLEQARDVARAVAAAQRHAHEWRIDPARFVLMGHSAGAHLVALLGADPRMLADAGALRPRGIVSLDSGALDVPALMSQPRVPKLYADAFGDERRYWLATSPMHRLARDALPMLLVCSSERRFPVSPCDEAHAFARKSVAFGIAMQVQPEPLDHGPINRDLGVPSAYTEKVAAYIDRLLR